METDVNENLGNVNHFQHRKARNRNHLVNQHEIPTHEKINPNTLKDFYIPNPYLEKEKKMLEDRIKSLKEEDNRMNDFISKARADFLKQETTLSDEIAKKKDFIEQLTKNAKNVATSDLLLKNKSLSQSKNDYHKELNMIIETNQVLQANLSYYQKNYEETKFAYDNLPNGTQSVFDIATKMVYLKYSTKLSKLMNEYESIKNEFESLSNEKTMLESIVSDLTQENKSFEQEIQHIQPFVVKLNKERDLLNDEISKRNTNTIFKEEMDKKIDGIKNEYRKVKKQEKAQLIQKMKRCIQENQFLYTQLNSKKEISSKLQEELENINDMFDRIVEDYNSRKKVLRTQYTNF